MSKRENLSVIKRPGDKSKVLCQEPYAQELYDRMYDAPTYSKDLKTGSILRVVDMRILPNEVEVVCDNFDTLYFTLSKERKYLDLLGLSEEQFKEWIKSGESSSHFQRHKTHVIVENEKNRKGSLYAAHLLTIVKEFREQILKPTSAYTAKILSKNQGGFFVEIQGVKAFLPGSLAAANKIVDFDEYIGKEIPVMIEDYLESSNIFVVSYKKYLDTILPSKLGELDRNQFMKGFVTGTSKFGIFVEFDEIYTGLLHTTEMSEETNARFANGEFKIGSPVEVWLKDIKDNKLILTEIDPSIRQNEMEEYKINTEGQHVEATVVSIKPHGALMELEKGVLGLLPLKEMKKAGKRLEQGEKFYVYVKKVDTTTGKIYLSLTNSVVEA